MLKKLPFICRIILQLNQKVSGKKKLKIKKKSTDAHNTKLTCFDAEMFNVVPGEEA